ncbi:hypothetical protein H6S82_14605 [Planktothrix sp. FACHB-1355]|uniref:Uncharacterized protein n=1 Tax=Aerosakkonema funiforme FACHB-1375 TaxID=2949571 RepID=A0A926ZJY9_9CYAN|nr:MULTISPECIES: hypothetical protein [Oscillatoriales]MBD2185199.1 hypothetical protein [Aerosakkonema funiforme FACHB-1375]MBD3560079.1 hypothetical protein [Planktothrix sp. FACHB-1355]
MSVANAITNPFQSSVALSEQECDRPFRYVSAGRDESAIVLFRMSVLMGMRVRSYFFGCQC